MKNQENGHGASHYGHVQGEIWEKGETETTQESQGKKKGNSRCTEKSQEAIREEEERQTLAETSPLPNGFRVSHPSPREMWLGWALYHRFYCVFLLDSHNEVPFSGTYSSGSMFLETKRILSRIPQTLRTSVYCSTTLAQNKHLIHLNPGSSTEEKLNC